MFLEPEGLDDPLIYPQGMSMSFKPEVQLEIMRSIPGLEKVELAYPGYLVEYEYEFRLSYVSYIIHCIVYIIIVCLVMWIQSN